ncbi:unnamed protein product [Tilletia controversa]|uniref:Uncharacterized protein n=1 Tax=Tilletia controversa TaxID=13291 RepID=A0A8X7SV39_9BASI|nr:hypothetical protein A4X06_0g5884 [Tilletia controversa]CAD6930528.1 unnamed protein product [Tilletia controversa]
MIRVRTVFDLVEKVCPGRPFYRQLGSLSPLALARGLQNILQARYTALGGRIAQDWETARQGVDYAGEAVSLWLGRRFGETALDFKRVLSLQLAEPLRRYHEEASKNPQKTATLHAWLCPKAWQGLHDGQGATAQLFMAIYEAQVSLHSQLRIRRPQEEQWTDQLPLPFGMDIVAACLNGPELAGPMLHTVGIFFSFLVELAKLCGIRFSAQAVAHGTIADDVLRKSLGKDTIPVRHTAYWTRQEITPVTSAMIIAIELAKYILASTKAPILLHGRRDFVRFYGFIRNNLLASAPCRRSRLWRDISPFQMIDDLFFGAICVSCRADIDPREAQLQALDALERDLANLATRSSYLRREVTTLMNSKAHLEDNLDAVQADLKKAQEELTQHRRATAVLTGMVGLTGRVIPEDIAAAVSKHFEIRAVRAPEGNPTSTDPPADASVRALASTFPERILGERDAEAVIRVVPGFQNKDREPTIPTLALARLFILASDQLLSKKELKDGRGGPRSAPYSGAPTPADSG